METGEFYVSNYYLILSHKHSSSLANAMRQISYRMHDTEL
jgi:hypothetical protein